MSEKWNRLHVNSCVSTNDEVKNWIAAGGSGSCRFSADQQTAGRGRLGRAWFSREGESLMVSFGFRSPLPAEKAASLTLTGAVALSEALESLSLGSKMEVKWPNDILSDGKKVAGILTEWVQGPTGDGWVVMGMGINLSIPDDGFPEELRSRATSVSNSVSKETADELAAAIERELTRHLETIQQTGVVDYTASAQRMRIGREVRLSVGGSSETGQVVGLSDTGGLRVLLSSGNEHVVVAGDIEPVEWR